MKKLSMLTLSAALLASTASFSYEDSYKLKLSQHIKNSGLVITGGLASVGSGFLTMAYFHSGFANKVNDVFLKSGIIAAAGGVVYAVVASVTQFNDIDQEAVAAEYNTIAKHSLAFNATGVMPKNPLFQKVVRSFTVSGEMSDVEKTKMVSQWIIKLDSLALDFASTQDLDLESLEKTVKSNNVVAKIENILGDDASHLNVVAASKVFALGLFTAASEADQE